MLRTKKDVDRHVRDVLNKVRTEDERKLRGYNIARSYFNIGEYESARRYLGEFLSVRPKAVDAHRLLGQIFEGLNMKEKAVQSYKMSYELGEGQKDLVLKICELYCDVPCDYSVRQYWADEGDRLFPHHEKVVRLREAVITASSSGSREELEKLYFDEIKANPLRVRLYTSLLQLYKNWEGREKDAYKYGCNIETRKAFPDSLEWYQTLCDTLEVYQNTADVSSDVEFHCNYLSVCERLVYLTLASSSGTALLSQCTHTDAVALLHKFDQNLAVSLKIVGEDSVFGQLMIGQLYLHMACFLLHCAKKDALLETDVSAGALLFHACRFLPSESGHPSRSQTSQDQFWYKLSCHRLSQAYHVLHHMAKTEAEKSLFLHKIKQKTANKEAQENIYRTVFGSSYSSHVESSFFINDNNFCEATATLAYPELEQVKKWDGVVGSMYCSSLRDMVWLCLQQAPSNPRESQPYYSFTLFEGLQFAANKMNTGAAETLCHLDLLAFLVATVFCHKAASKGIHGPTSASLPTVVTSALNTNEQSEWWSAAFTLFTNRAHQRLNKLRLTLQRGLEVIRAIGNHGIDLVLMAHLAQCFTRWAQTAKTDGSTRSDIDALEERAKHYWDCVLALCQKIARNSNMILPRNRLFVVQSESLSPSEMEKVQEEGKYFLAMRLVHSGKKQEAIQALGNLKSPEASFERAMLYKEQAVALLISSSEDSVTAEKRSQYASLLRQARDTLYLTLDRLRMPEVDRVHPLNARLSQQLEDVERKLSSITLDQDMTHREEDSESLSDDSQSQRLDLSNGHVNSISQSSRLFSTPVRDNRNSSRIARQEARPSPERLDAQVRALTDIQEHTLRNMEEQNVALRSQNEALRKLCTSMNEDFKENAALYRSILEQNKNPSPEVFTSLVTEIKQIQTVSQDAFTSLLTEMKQMQSNIQILQTDVRSIAEDLSEVLKTLKSGSKLPERTEAKLEEQVPVEIPAAAAAVVPPGLNNYYVNYYDQQVPYPYRPSPGFLRFPPFSPPSTIADQSYTTTVGQAAGISTLAQSGGAIATPTPTSASAIISKETMPSPVANISVSQGISHGSFSSLSWTVSPSLHTTTTNSKSIAVAKESSGTPAHNYQIPMPATVSALTPPPGSTPGEQSSLSLPCSTSGLLANVPAPLYSAVTPDSSPLRGQSKVKSLSTVLSPEGLTPASGSREVTSTTSDSKDASLIIESPEVAKSSPNKTRDITDDEEHDPCPDYKPLIPLPEKVEVRTGEEDEEVLFEDRAKLFRFIEKEWRERGTGVIKLLYNPAQDTVRVLMRRDQTHKVCANHLVLSTIDLQPAKNCDRAWMWAAQDYADEEIRTEKFCCRFKNVEIATSFKEAFTKAKEIANKKESATNNQETKTDNVPGHTIMGQKSLGEMFKPAVGSWNCETCLVNNLAENTTCVACQTPNPNASKTESSSKETQKPYADFKFVSSSTTTTASSTPFVFKFDTSAASSVTVEGTTSGFKASSFTTSSSAVATSISSSASTVVSSSNTSSSKDGTKEKFMFSGFSFFTPPTVKPEKDDETPQKPASDDKKKVFANFTFANLDSKTPTSSSFNFSASESKPASTGIFSGTANSGNMLSFGGVAAGSTPTSSIFQTSDTKAFEPKPLFDKSSAKTPSKEDSEDKVDDYEPQVDFTPVIPLPDLVEVKTGEEEEVVLFCERCKLFRYDKETKEWKERGVGELKILKNNTSGKVRVLMRRDQVHKVCANHFITAEIKLTQMASSDKAWVWAAHDFADEEMKEEKFAARFKTQEIALSFKTAFECAQKSLDDIPQTSREENVSSVTSQEPDKPKAMSLAEMFRPKSGSWECGTCLVLNGPETEVCAACSSTKPGAVPQKEKILVSQEKSEDSKTSTLASLFKPPEGSWECSTCLVRNKAEDKACIACGAGGAGSAVSSVSVLQPTFMFGIKKDESCSSSGTLPASGFTFSATDKQQTFSFGIPSSSVSVSATTTQPAFSFGVPSQQSTKAEDTGTSDKTAFSFGVPSQQPAKIESTATGGKATFSFGVPPQESSKTVLSEGDNKPPAFSFGGVDHQSSKTFSFTNASAAAVSSTASVVTSGATPTTPVKDTKPDFVFGSPGKYDFTFSGVRAKSPRSRDISVCESEEGVVDEDEGDHLYFEPVIPLPDKVEVVTGEEDEIVLYSSRAKLHRLVSGEWKERGLGDVKVLEHKQSVKIRLLMRREQVHKICLNHYIAKDMELRKKDEKTFFWAAVDYSENTPQQETFAIRFKTPEVAADFFKAVDNAKVKLGGSHSEMPAVTPSKKNEETSSSDIVTSTPKATFAAADSTTPTPTMVSTPTGSIFGGITGKSLFGGSAGSTGSLFGNTLGGTAKSNEPNFSVNVSSSFTLKSPHASGSLLFGGTSAFGGAASTTSPRAPLFSFGDRFSSQDSTSATSSSIFSMPDDASVEIVYEKKATPEQIEKARSLQLPDNFYLYEEASPCPGCRGCEDDLDTSYQEKKEMPSGLSLSSGSPAVSLFGNNGGTPGALFGKDSKSISGATTQSLFGGSTLFGSNKPAISFGSVTASTSSIFSSSTSTSFFGTNTTTTSSIFGSNASSSTAPNVFSSSSTTTSAPTLFGASVPSPSIFSSATTATGIFDSSAAAVTTTSSVFSSVTSTPSMFATSTSTISFADIAKSSSAGFGQASQVKSDVWSARGQPVFGHVSPKKDGDTTNEDDEDNHDPHFEPVVPLPDLVEVKTGEEDWEIIFCSRGKLYRYDGPTKQWKERGVGDFKILYDPANNKYRLLQRREQVYKTCCNHYLTPQLELRPMQSSETAWCWHAIDFSENLEGKNEQLAIRFKTKELAVEFKTKFEECQEKLRQAPSSSVSETASATFVLPPPSQTPKKSVVDEDDDDDDDEEEEEEEDEEEEEEEEDEDDEDEEEEEEEEDDGENPVIFLKRCTMSKKDNGDWKTLGMGDLKILYDDEFFGARIHMVSDGGETLAEHVIAIQTTMHKEGNAAIWTVLNLKPSPASQVTFKAQFSSAQALEEFASAFNEGKEYAENSGLVEQPAGVGGEVAPEDLYYGQGAQGTEKEKFGSGSTLPFSFGQVLSCDPNLTKDIAAALQEYFPTQNSNPKKD